MSRVVSPRSQALLTVKLDGAANQGAIDDPDLDFDVDESGDPDNHSFERLARECTRWLCSESAARFFFVILMFVLFGAGAYRQLHHQSTAINEETLSPMVAIASNSSWTNSTNWTQPQSQPKVKPDEFTRFPTFRASEQGRCERVMRAAQEINSGEWLKTLRSQLLGLEPEFEKMIYSVVARAKMQRTELRRREYKERFQKHLQRQAKAKAAATDAQPTDAKITDAKTTDAKTTDAKTDSEPSVTDFFPALPAEFDMLFSANSSAGNASSPEYEVKVLADSEREFSSLAELCPALVSWAERCPNHRERASAVMYRIYHSMDHCSEVEARDRYFGGISVIDQSCDTCDLRLSDFWPDIMAHPDQQHLMSEFSVIVSMGLQASCVQWAGMTSAWPLIALMSHKHTHPVPCSDMKALDQLAVGPHATQFLQESIDQRLFRHQAEHSADTLHGGDVEAVDHSKRNGHTFSVEELQEHAARLAKMGDTSDLMVSTRWPPSLRYWYNLKSWLFPNRDLYSQVNNHFGIGMLQDVLRPFYKAIYDIELDDPWVPEWGYSSQTFLDYRSLADWAQYQLMLFIWLHRLHWANCPVGPDPSRCLGYFMEWSNPYFQMYTSDWTESGALHEGLCDQEHMHPIGVMSLKQRHGKPFLPAGHFRSRIRLAYDVLECHVRPDNPKAETPIFDTKHLSI